MSEPKKCAFVTGGSRDIGSGIVKELVKEGWDVAFTYHKAEEEAEALAEELRQSGGRVFCFQAALEEPDVPEEVTAKAIAALGRINLLVNNAGVTKWGYLTELDADLMDLVYSLNFRAYFMCTKTAARHMIENRIRGSVINISSVRGMSVYPHDGLYGGIEAAINRSVKSFALELGAFGIRVNNIAPGEMADTEDMRTIRAGAAYKIPLKRKGTPRDIANAVLFLASDKASYITGTTMVIDGGLGLPGIPEDVTPAAGYGWSRLKETANRNEQLKNDLIQYAEEYERTIFPEGKPIIVPPPERGPKKKG